MKVPSYNRENRRTDNSYETLPKGNYVCKIMKAEEHTSKEGKISIKLSFDIAEGDYKDFYAKKYQEDTREDKKWNRDAEYYISIPTDSSTDFIKTKYDTFFANLEDSNNGYVFQGNLDELKGKIFGAIMFLEQNEYNGRIYDHVKIFDSRIAQDVRDGKIRFVPKDKMVGGSPSDDFVAVAPGSPEDLPF